MEPQHAKVGRSCNGMRDSMLRASRVKFVHATVSLAVVIFWVALSTAQTVKEVVVFTGDNELGTPGDILAEGRNAEIYGTCPNVNDTDGSIFSLTPSGNITNLYTFNFTTGAAPSAGLSLATDGNFYGTASGGGTGRYGTLFRISPQGTYTVLHNFLGGSDGAGPEAAPIEASDGNFYGTTSGASGIFFSTVYKYTRSGTYATIYQFDNAQGESIGAPLVQGSDGNLYGTANQGGAAKNGSIYKLSTSGTLLYLYSFPGGKYGEFPSGLIQASDGNFYGTTSYGGTTGRYGTVFKMDQLGEVSILYKFKGSSDGSRPTAGVMQATDGNLYGTTSARGANGYGSIFQLSLTGKFKLLYSFPAAIGQNPSGLVQHTNGLFYGSLQLGSTYGYGTIYSLDMGLGPFITFVRSIGKVGQTVEILGHALEGTTEVTFNGVPASSFTVVSETYMTAVVPSGATTGPMVVTTQSGALTSNKAFRILE
jgi:uncharacterized repeat protein (TIGR03803 family)